MLRFIVRRLAATFAMVAALSVLMFCLLRLTPGDPVSAYMDPMAALTEADVAALRVRLGLDKPLPVQYLAWAKAALQGDLGFSTQHERARVGTLLAERAGPTLLLMGTGVFLAILLGVVAGVVASIRRDGPVDIALAVVSSLGISSPAFLTALVVLFVFAVRLHLAPSGGMTTPGVPVTAGDVLAHLVLPATVLAIAQATLTLRYMRAAMLEEFGRDYIRTARAKGVTETRVITWHALRNALLPVVTLIGANIGTAVGGAIFTESVFNWPGMGLLLINAVEQRDYPLIMGAALVIGTFVLLVNLATDLACAAIDPRIRVH
jgi:peptide/nickel transport system permease protein